MVSFLPFFLLLLLIYYVYFFISVMSGPKFILFYVDILQSRRPRLNTWVRKICWRREHYPLPYTGLENSMDRGAWWVTVHVVAKSWTQLTDLHFHFYSVVPAAFVEEIIHFSLNGLGTLVENHLAVEVRIYF